MNGERCRYLPQEKLLLSSTENPIYSVPHIQKILAELNPDIELDGELFVNGMPFDGDEGIHAIVSREVNQHYLSSCMEYHLFDICDESATQFDRLVRLTHWYNDNNLHETRIKLTPLWFCENLEQVHGIFDHVISLGYEGIIVRHELAPYIRKRSTFVMKFKPKESDTYEIIGFEEEHTMENVPKNRLGCLVLRGSTGDVFRVYSGFDDALRNHLWSIRETLVGNRITCYYQNLSKRGVPIFGRVNSQELKTIWQIDQPEKN